MLIPMLKLPPFFGGQMGVPGSDSPLGLRTHSDGVVLYVAPDNLNATDSNDGTNPVEPKATMAGAIASSLLVPHSVIRVCGDIDETVVVPATAPSHVTILGDWMFAPTWGPALAAGGCLSIDAYGWRISGLHFQPGTAGAGVQLTRTAGSGAENTVIDNCFFEGMWGASLYVIDLNGAPANVKIINSRFAEFGAAKACITVTATGIADPYQTQILGCTFQESDEYISRDCAGGWNQTVIWGCLFADGTHDAAFPAGAGGTAVFIDMRGGSNGYNTVVYNFLGGDYSNTGGYWAGTGDSWQGNVAFDIAEAEVGAESFTIAIPAA